MSAAVEAIARVVLYEGYVLYPYRASATKNRHRWSPGGLAPGGGVGSALRAECLLLADHSAVLSVCVRFLHPLLRSGGGTPPAQEATEREIELSAALRELAEPRRVPVESGAGGAAPGERPRVSGPSRPSLGPLTRGRSPETLIVPFEFPALELEGDTERMQYGVLGEVEVSADRLSGHLHRVAVRVTNLTPVEPGADRDIESLRTLASAHVVLRAEHGEWVSLTDPPADLRAAADDCRNEGVWPVLVGESGNRDTVLASPIILPDYPQVAQDAGDFFDSTEIDEMLALRVLTLTDAEKRKMQSDLRARTILERVETLSDSAMGRLHGAVRASRGVAPGDRVRLRPRGRADALDVLLAGKTATVAAVETDFEGIAYAAVVLDDDPGGDFGDAGQIAHRFFFRVEEVELLTEDAR